MRRILLTGFSHTSSEELLKQISMFEIRILPNDKVMDGKLLTEQIAEGKYDLVIGIGQKPAIKDRVYIETTARSEKMTLRSQLNCELVAQIFVNNQIAARLSDNAGNSFCNALYWNGLQYITQHHMQTGMLFIHIPFSKNISEPELFKRRFLAAIKEIQEWEAAQ